LRAQPLDGAMALKIQLGGTMTLTSAGIDASGIWREAEDGITITVHSQKFKLPYRDGKLSLIYEGRVVCFERADRHGLPGAGG
jgi:hypothetical protein